MLSEWNARRVSEHREPGLLSGRMSIAAGESSDWIPSFPLIMSWRSQAWGHFTSKNLCHLNEISVWQKLSFKDRAESLLSELKCTKQSDDSLCISDYLGISAEEHVCMQVPHTSLNTHVHPKRRNARQHSEKLLKKCMEKLKCYSICFISIHFQGDFQVKTPHIM